MARLCVICQGNVDGKGGIPIKEDRIITTIRAIKKKLNIAQMNELYVCNNDLAKHAERRKSFEKSMMVATVLAGIILVVMVIAIVLSGRFDAWGIVAAFILAGFVIILPIFKYTPAIAKEPIKIVDQKIQEQKKLTKPKVAPKKEVRKQKR